MICDRARMLNCIGLDFLVNGSVILMDVRISVASGFLFEGP